MNLRICKWLVSFAVYSCLIFFVSTVAAGKPDKPPGKPPKSGPEPNHALAVAGFKASDIRVMDVDGGNSELVERKASPFGTMAMVWSPDGTRIIWAEMWLGTLQMINADGSNRQESVPTADGMEPYIGGQHNLAGTRFDCAGNDDRNLVYFLGTVEGEPWDEEFYVVDLDEFSTPPVRLTQDNSKRHTTLEVSPDGQLIATWTYSLDGNWDDAGARLEIRQVCGGGLPSSGLPVIASWTAEELGQFPGYQFFARIDWSIDDILAVAGFSSVEGPNPHDIYIIDLNPEYGPVTADKVIGSEMNFGADVSNRCPTWSPDGTQLAFSSDNEIYILDWDTGFFTFVVDAKTTRDMDWRPTWVADQ